MSKSALKKSLSRRLKKHQLKGRGNSPLILGVIVLVSLLGLIFGGKLLNLVDQLNTPYTPDGPVDVQTSQWNGDSPLNLVVKGADLSLLSFNPVEKSLILVKIPSETYLNLAFGFGQWEARSIYNLGQAEKPPLGAILLMRSIESNLGLPINGYLILPDNLSQVSEKEWVEKLRQDFFSLNIFRESKTDLSILSLVKLWQGLRGVRFDKVEILDLGQSDFTSWVLLRDGSRVLRLNQLKLDQYLQSRFEDSKLKNESLSVGIFNGTTHPGLAEKVARLITNIGGRVIFTTDSDIKVSTSLVSGQPSYTRSRLADIFASLCQGKSGCSKPLEINLGRADVNIVLGEDYFLRYNTK